MKFRYFGHRIAIEEGEKILNEINVSDTIQHIIDYGKIRHECEKEFINAEVKNGRVVMVSHNKKIEALNVSKKILDFIRVGSTFSLDGKLACRLSERNSVVCDGKDYRINRLTGTIIRDNEDW